jgi:hypothetical protein
LGDKEKNATSDPEIKAEHNNKMMIKIAAPLTSHNGKSASKKEELKREAKNVPGMESNCFIFLSFGGLFFSKQSTENLIVHF